MADVTLQQYQAAERQAAHDEGRRGFRIHALVTVVVWVALVAINVAVGGFPWVVFPIAGMSIGLWFHWHFGVAQSDELTRRHQDSVERRARAA